MWDFFFQTFGFSLARRRVTSDMNRVFLLYLPFCEKECFLWMVGVCVVLWVLWGEGNNQLFWGSDRGSF